MNVLNRIYLINLIYHNLRVEENVYKHHIFFSEMKVLSIKQPWAELILLGRKRLNSENGALILGGNS